LNALLASFQRATTSAESSREVRIREFPLDDPIASAFLTRLETRSVLLLEARPAPESSVYLLLPRPEESTSPDVRATATLGTFTPPSPETMADIAYRIASPSGDSVELHVGEEVAIGSDASCGIRTDGGAEGRVLARLRVVPEAVELRDVGSTNGTWVAGMPVRSVVVDEPVIFTIGHKPSTHYVDLQILTPDAAGAPWRLMTLNGPTRGEVLVIPTRSVRIGSSPECDVVLHAPFVSRFHAEIEVRRCVPVLETTGEQADTAGQPRLRARALYVGEEFVVGALHLRLESVSHSPSGTLRFLESKTEQARPYPLRREVIVVGRSRSADITLDDPAVTRSHCRFRWSGGMWEVEDLMSKNGTLVNGRRITRARLSVGDRIQIGQSILEYQD
jgi:pSer/pThr/pTyr-binding forkhead associated (FHA) protein